MFTICVKYSKYSLCSSSSIYSLFYVLVVKHVGIQNYYPRVHYVIIFHRWLGLLLFYTQSQFEYYEQCISLVKLIYIKVHIVSSVQLKILSRSSRRLWQSFWFLTTFTTLVSFAKEIAKLNSKWWSSQMWIWWRVAVTVLSLAVHHF